MSRWAVVIVVLLAAGIVGSLPLRAPSAARDTSEEILVRLAADGGVTVWVGPDSHNLREVALNSSRLGEGRAETSQATLEAMQPVLEELVETIGRDENGQTRAHMRIETAPLARTTWLMWLVQVGVDPRTQIARYDLSTRGNAESLTWVLPSDNALDPPPLYPDLSVRIVLPAGTPPETLALHVQRHVGLPARRGPFGPRNENLAQRRPAPMILECGLDQEGTPGPLQPLVAEVRRLRSLERERDVLWLLIAYPRGEAGGELPARTLIDLFGALQQVEGVRVKLGSDASLPDREPAQEDR